MSFAVAVRISLKWIQWIGGLQTLEKEGLETIFLHSSRGKFSETLVFVSAQKCVRSLKINV